MKKLLAIVVLIAIALVVLRRHGADHQEKAAVSAQAGVTPAGSNYFKRPLDRTHEVIDQVKKQRREDNY